jgi:hypothetical protein
MVWWASPAAATATTTTPQQQQQQHPPPVIATVTHPQQPLPRHPLNRPCTAHRVLRPTTTELSAAEVSRRERVRTAARERQRKHRALVKQKKLRELGLDMGNELGVQGLEDMQFRLAAADGTPFGALQHDMGQQPIPGQPDPAFPPGHNGGQTFASTLLLSFSCAPLLKQHILRTLSMTNEELASLEPIIAQAWDQWDHQVRHRRLMLTSSFSDLCFSSQRRLHYAHQAQAAAGAGKPPDGHPLGEAPPPPAPFATAVDMGDAQVAPQPFPPTDPNQPPQANDFRARFHRSLVAPSPFRSFAPPQPGAPADGIDPHLGAEQSPKAVAAAAAAAAATAAAVAAASAIDPKLGQARGEAEGVVGRLERG